MHSFSSIYTSLLKTFSVSRMVYSKPAIRKDLLRSWIFRYFSFTFYIQFILFAGKEALEIKRKFDQFTLAHSSLILNFIAEGHLWAGNKSAQNFRDCRRISVIVHCSACEELAVVHSSCLFRAESYFGQRERKSVWQGLQWKVCELVSGKLSKCLYSAISRKVVGKNVHDNPER